ncbi:unnamed protein product [Brassicogethes aeneus]|uniref:Peroxidase n=1 Tax=Brassicogethes aeneus TaxID=1431903 RepID=A0A9P0AW50_BRAAE|nr:unnamed protein product [Brassicogethes aeneus]
MIKLFHIFMLVLHFMHHSSSDDSVKSDCVVSPPPCTKSKYRSYDGTCNNLKKPLLGSSNTPYRRLLPANYGDGISSPPLSKSGQPLPLARYISTTVYPDIPLKDPIWTLNTMQWGQIITHDLALLKTTGSDTCCANDNSTKDEKCWPITIPPLDIMSLVSNTKCMSFLRTDTDRDGKCVEGNQPAEQINSVNHFLDLSIVYGISDESHKQLRENKGGRLIVEQRNDQDWPPHDPTNPTCLGKEKKEACYLAGDTRVNQNTQLTLLQVILLREHNRIADVLFKLNPHWDDETIFQEARKILIAQHQHISYYEMLHIFLGKKELVKEKIIYETEGFVNDYDENVDPAVLNEHSHAAFRYFHSLIAGHLKLVLESRLSFSKVRLSSWLNRPSILEEENNFDDLSRGLATQSEYLADAFHTSEITQFLFRGNNTFGKDLKATDIQRNRDHGLARYNDYREYCGLKRAKTFWDLLGSMSPLVVFKLSKIYKNVDDIDLSVGGSLENHAKPAMVGTTFLCIIKKQFYRTRVGDRFWFENGGETGFTLDQLKEIRKSSISRLLCDNSHNVKLMQPRGFEKISLINLPTSCNNLPAVNLTLWKDPVP